MQFKVFLLFENCKNADFPVICTFNALTNLGEFANMPIINNETCSNTTQKQKW